MADNLKIWSQSDWENESKLWHVPIGTNKLLKNAVLKNDWKLDPMDVPWVIKLVENPKYKRVFPGRVTLENHDCIHTLLGRGLLSKDEAFVIGFTMGSTGKMTWWKERLFLMINRLLYPKGYKFSRGDALVFRLGVALSELLPCEDLSKVDFSKHMNKKLESIRQELGVSTKFLKECYKIEKMLFPNSPESQRLADPTGKD